MKKFVFLLTLMFMLVFCNSCMTVYNNIKLSKSETEITAIDIYDITERYNEENLHFLRDENTPIYTLTLDQQDRFLQEFFQFKYEKEIILFPIPMDGGCDCFGYVVSIVYNNGSYDLFAFGGTFSYSIGKNGKEQYSYDHANYCGEKNWANFIEVYIDKKP